MSCKIRCIDCRHETPYLPMQVNCPKCDSQWREAFYDYESLRGKYKEMIQERPCDLWRYRELLPVSNPIPSLRMGEGGTPLIPAVSLGRFLGLQNLFIKDERQGPSTSFKDRQAAVTIAALKEAGITEMVTASTGNVAIAYSAFAARAGIRVWAFVTGLVPAAKMREIALYGSRVVIVAGSYDQAKQVASEFAVQRNLFQDMGARTITSVEGMKTIAFEIAEQLTWALGPVEKTGRTLWRTPDWYIQAISGGLGPLGVAKGFREMELLDLAEGLPAMGMIQTDGCAPMVQSWKEGLVDAINVTNPETRIETLATGTPGRSYQLLRKEVDAQSGVFESVTDEEAFRAMHALAKMEGVSAEPAAGAAFAGLFKLARAGVIRPTDVVVVNCTGHTLPAEPVVLGNGWSRDAVLPTRAEEKAAPQEEGGLLAALSRVAPDRFARIAIVDDKTDARRLVRRILQSQGNYTIFEAGSGKEGIELITRELPDLVVLELMMPEVDGFAVLEILKANSATAQIPVIVSTAREST